LEGDNYDDYKRTSHEAAIHIPLIIDGPGFKGGNVIDDLVSLIDFPPTILAAAGIETPDVMRGKPLQNLVQGKHEDWPQEAFLQISESQVGRAIRTKKWKYSVRAPGRSGVEYAASDVYGEDYLYDLENDPHELHNLVQDPAYADVREELSEILIRRMTEIGEPEPQIRSA
jgi:arylsulfatase A-like enzyme